MIHTINITTSTKEGDAYPRVAINEYPIVFIDDKDAKDILDDKELIGIIKDKIKNKTTYQNAVINIRTIDDDYNIKDTDCILDMFIDIPEWK